MRNPLFSVRAYCSCLLLLSVLMNGCAMEQTRRPDSPQLPGIFRSDEYIVYPVQHDDTAASLAERYLGDPRKAWWIEDANPGAVRPGDYIAIPLKPRNRGGITTRGIQTVPILCYHRFGDQCDSPLCMTTEVFERQMRFLKDKGYRVISPENLIDYLEYRRPLPKKAVMITVDDGYRSFYTTAYPILKKYGFTATLFVYTDFVGVSSKAITWDQLRDLKANGFTIGSHTISHSDLTLRAAGESETDYLERLHRELKGSKAIIDKQLNQDTWFFAYPFGRANAVVVEMAEQAGYKLAVTVNRGGNPFFASPYTLRRDQILQPDLALFESHLKTFFPIQLR